MTMRGHHLHMTIRLGNLLTHPLPGEVKLIPLIQGSLGIENICEFRQRIPAFATPC
jgi:hypothetical protein